MSRFLLLLVTIPLWEGLSFYFVHIRCRLMVVRCVTHHKQRLFFFRPRENYLCRLITRTDDSKTSFISTLSLLWFCYRHGGTLWFGVNDENDAGVCFWSMAEVSSNTNERMMQRGWHTQWGYASAKQEWKKEDNSQWNEVESEHRGNQNRLHTRVNKQHEENWSIGINYMQNT